MTEKLGVLLVDVPEPSMWEYTYVELDDDRDRFSIEDTAVVGVVSCYDCAWKNEYEEWEFTPTVCPACGGDVELEEF